jgi:uncharacterized membrane protein
MDPTAQPPGGGEPGPYPPIQPPAFLPPTPRRAFTVGEVLGETFSIFFSSPVPILVSAVVLVPLSGLSLALISSLEGRQELLWMVGILNLVDSLIVTPIATGAVVYTVFQRMRGRNPDVGESLRIGLSMLGSVLLVAILQGLAILVGFVLCIIPGIIFGVMYTVAVPVAIEERPGASQAMTRSAELTDGHRWDVFFVLAGLFLLAAGLGVVVGLATFLNKAVEIGLTLVVEVLATGLSATAYTVMYYRLRSVKESLDVDQIASVFD